MNTHTIAASRSRDATAPPLSSVHAGHAGRRGWLRFIGHFVEMVVVMLLGMGVLTAVLGMPHTSPVAVQALYMAATMTVPMVGWMLIRRHTPRATIEMGAAMVLPLAVLFPMLGAGRIAGDALLDLQHLLMLPAMLGAMLHRRQEYGL
jgi:flagellar biosynthetic protein FliP